MINLGSAVGYLLLDTTSFTEGMSSALRQLDVFRKQGATATDKLTGLGSAMTTAGKTLTKNVTVPLATLGGVAVKSAVDFESAFTGVRKTVDATEEEFGLLSKGLQDMSSQMPQSASELASIMEVAGQLGVRGTENLLTFTETMAMLGDTTNLSSEEAATAIARVMNIMGTSEKDVSRFGSTIVDLGNNFATTESEIVAMTNRLAAGGKLAGLTEPQIMALATAMSSVGIEAEAGGTAMTQTFNAIEKAVASGGENLEGFARIAGMSSAEFVSAWKNEPIAAIQSFIEGLGKLDEQGESAVLVLDELGLTGIRQSNMLKSLGLASDMLSDAVGTANKAWKQNNALTKEAGTRYGTTESQIKMLRNNLQNLATSFGQLILPYLNKLVEWLSNAVKEFNSFDEGTKKAILSILSIVAAIGPVLSIGGKLIKGISTVISLVSGAGGLSAVLTALTGPIGIIIGAIAALAAAWATDFGGIREYTSEIFDSLKTIFTNIGAQLKALWDNDWAFIRTIVTTVWNTVESITRTTFEVLSGLFEFFAKVSEGDWSGAWEAIKNVVLSAYHALTSIVSNIMNAIWGIITNVGRQLWNSITRWIDNVISKVKEVFSFLSGSGSQYSGGMGLQGYQGSYASGLDYVPRDMTVKVHEGEAIITKEENKNRSASSIFGTVNINIDGAKYSDEQSLAKAVAYEIQNLAERRASAWT